MKNKNINKSYSRFFAVQILFSYFFDKGEDNIIDLKSFIEEYYIFNILNEEEYKNLINKDFLEELLINTVKNVEKIDSILINNLKNNEKYNFDNIDDLIKIIFRLSLYEFIWTNTEKKIIINEYVDISAEYYDETTIAFINANLDKLSKIEYDKL